MEKEVEKLADDTELSNIIDSLENKLNDSGSKKAFFEKLKYSWNKLREVNKEFLKKTPLLMYSLKRIIYAFITLYIAIAVVYVLMVAFIRDADIMNDFNVAKPPVKINSPEYFEWVKNKKIALGIYGPMIEQIFNYLKNITPFIPKEIRMPLKVSNMGITWGEPQTKWFWLGLILNKSNGIINYPVMDSFKDAMPISFTIGFSAVIISYLFGVPLGIIAAKNKEKPIDSFISWLFLLIISAPATIIIALFWMFSLKYMGSAGIWDEDDYTNFLAVIGVVLLIMPSIVISTRRYVIDEMTADYTRFAQSKGLSSSYIFYVHIFRNAGIRIIRLIPGALILSLFGSSILVERFWSAPGMSKYILTGVSTNDVFVVLGYITLSAGVGVFSSLISDLILVLMDPRVKL
ncbi:oligopeptide ABC transporter permease OppB [Spiroplasma turonicum]|uniref:Oligopeptide ABC transporter permease component n=1 Tax=Spiroplasma turonicum TaxID=216946 RepID=A0A0K1P722_9MOLU|nr:oligopeptide ABC transporter permease OppB [Spiroplasma turonicum]AKU79687.1 oligopeptide ABC transporter permease component [Spiroplasma turonicum]ALX70707.1 oligopeptide ABC transporter permease [Spiroplasma turonicum]